MPTLAQRLRELARPIRVAVVGAGYMGSGVANAVENAPGMTVSVVFDEDAALAGRVARKCVPKARVAQELTDACTAADVDVVVDGTAIPRLGADAATLAIDAGKHVVSVNIECDVTVGSALAERARNAGVGYTVTAGDDPGGLKTLYDHYDAIGFRVVALGKGKNNPLDVSATPDTVRPTLPDNGITAEQVTSFVDGSKTMFEMGCIGNAVGFTFDSSEGNSIYHAGQLRLTRRFRRGWK